MRAILEIALDDSEHGIFQKDISVRQKISIKYLDSIISSLKTAGLIMNVKGKKSGYKLTRKPDKINALDVYKAFEPQMAVVECANENFTCDLSSKCAVKEFWGGLNNTIVHYMESCTLDDLIKEHRKKNAGISENQPVN